LIGDLVDLIFALSIMFLAGIVQGFAGFGFSLVSVPILIIFLPAQLVIPSLIIPGLALNIAVLFEVHPHLDMKRIWPLIVTAFIGIPIGAHILKTIDVSVLKIFVGMFIIVTATLLYIGWRRPLKKEWKAFLPIGFISGILQGAITTSGPPVILFLTNQGDGKNRFRASLVFYFLILNILTIPTFILNGLFTREVIIFSFEIVPALVSGALLGMWLARRVHDSIWRRIALGLVALSGLMGLFSGLEIL
jgi:uncharacterized membrane protein YfcA